MSETTAARAPTRDRTHYLYLAVIAAVVLGIIVGFAAPGFAVQLKPLGTGFVNLIKMMISPIIFCTIVLGIGSVRQAAKVGKVGGLALGYFLVMSTAALAIGLVVGNLIHPGEGLQLTQALKTAGAKAAGGPAATGAVDFLLNVIPTTLFSALTQSQVLQTLLVALLVGFALQSMGRTGEPVLRGIRHLPDLRHPGPGHPALDGRPDEHPRAAALPRPRVPADRVHLVVGIGAPAADRQDGAPGRLPDGRRGHRAHRVLVQSRRHRHLPDDGVAVRRRCARPPAVHRAADL